MKKFRARPLQTIPVIVGPTGSGKTAVSLVLARWCQAEILSAASRQVYRQLSIGTAKPDGVWIHNGRHPVRDYYDVEGVPQNTVTRANPAAGRVGFQLEGVPFELRAVRLTPLD